MPSVSGVVWGRRSRSYATALRAALDAVAASWTIESEEDGSEHLVVPIAVLILLRYECGPVCGGRASQG